MQKLYGDMVQDREIVPKNTVGYSVYDNFIFSRNFRSMTDFPRKGSIPAVYAIGIDDTSAGTDQMSYPFVSSVEQAFPVKWGTLEYGSKLEHNHFLNNETTREQNPYVLMENFTFPIL